jgi:hydrogenase expression/formation protein HypC
MCLGIAGQIVELMSEQTDLVTADVMGVSRTVNVGLVGKDGLKCGDWVLIHVGFAIAKMEEEEAKAALAFLRDMEEQNGETLMAKAPGNRWGPPGTDES